MKTNLKSLFLILAVAVPFLFTSCGNDGDGTIPNIELVGSINTTASGHGAIVLVTCDVESSINKVTAWAVFNNGESTSEINIPNNAIARTSGQSWTVTINNIPMAVSGHVVETLRVTAETRDGGNRTVNFEIKTTPVTTPLSAKVAFTLGRPGTVQYPEILNGINWTSNPNATTARFTAQNIVLTKAQYDAMETVEDLKAFVVGKSFATTFEAQSDANFGGTKYYIIQDGSTLRLVEFVSLAFIAGANRATFTERH